MNLEHVASHFLIVVLVLNTIKLIKMEKSKRILFFELCRLCLSKPGVRSIFETEDLPKDIHACTGVKVSRSENLPSKICFHCSDIVKNATELRVLAVKNDLNMRYLFSTEDKIPINTHDDQSKLHISDIDNSHTQDVDKQTASICSSTDNESQSCESSQQTITPMQELTEVTSSCQKCDTVKVNKNTIVQQRIELICRTCSKTFDKWKKYYLHQRMHNKIIMCPIEACGKSFATKGDLQKHLRVHTGEKPFKCDVCPKAFSQQGSLKAHKEHVHSAKRDREASTSE